MYNLIRRPGSPFRIRGSHHWGSLKFQGSSDGWEGPGILRKRWRKPAQWGSNNPGRKESQVLREDSVEVSRDEVKALNKEMNSEKHWWLTRCGVYPVCLWKDWFGWRTDGGHVLICSLSYVVWLFNGKKMKFITEKFKELRTLSWFTQAA